MKKIGIIGCGQIAQQHVQSYAHIPDVQIVACADIDQDAAHRLAAQCGAEMATTNFREVLDRPEIDAVDVCLHNNLHMPVTVLALEAGKHVYCEKPMAGSYVDAVTMLETARKCDRMLHIQLFTLYTDETRAARELIDSGELGELYFARSTGHRRRGRPYVDGYGTPTFVQKRNSAGGALYDMGVYHISQVLYLLGNPVVERISGKTYQRTGMDAKRRETSGYDVEELGAGFIRCANDLAIDIIESWAVNLDPFEGSFVLGSEGGVRLQPFGFFKNVGNLELSSTADLGAARFRWKNVQGDGDFYASSQAHWIAALHEWCPLLPSAEVALNTMLVSEGIYLSQALDREVTAEEVKSASKSTSIQI
jgi:predicted dehydrogenase